MEYNLPDFNDLQLELNFNHFQNGNKPSDSIKGEQFLN